MPWRPIILPLRPAVTHAVHALLFLVIPGVIAQAPIVRVTPSGATLNAASFCARPGVLDQTCIERAVAAAQPGQQVSVPAGVYTGTVSTLSASNLSLVLAPHTVLQYRLDWSGAGYSRSHTVNLPSGIPAGSTTLSGDFSAYAPGQTVLIEQRNGGPALELGIVASASPGRLTLRSPTRFAYASSPTPSPTISLVSGATHLSATLTANTLTIPGDYRGSFAAGDLLRVENTTQNDDASHDSGYFEIVRVASISLSAITLAGALHATYGNPWLIRLQPVSNIVIHGNGGSIRNLNLRYVDNLTADNLLSQSFHVDFAYNVQLAGLHDNAAPIPASPASPAIPAQPIALGLTFVYHGSLNGVVASGAESYADNGNVKIAQCDDLSIANISTSGGIAHAEGSYPFMLDFDFPPYNPWNANLTISNVTAGLSSFPISVFLGGLRNSTLSGIHARGAIKLLNGSNVTATSIDTPVQIIFWSGTGYALSNVTAGSISIGDAAPVTNSQLTHFTITGQPGLNPPASIWIRNNSTNWKLSYGSFSPSTNTSILVNDASVTHLSLDNITDAPTGHGASIANPSHVPLALGAANHFKSAIDPSPRP